MSNSLHGLEIINAHTLRVYKQSTNRMEDIFDLITEVMNAAPGTGFTDSEILNLLSFKANQADIYTQSQISTSLALKLNTADGMTANAINTALN